MRVMMVDAVAVRREKLRAIRQMHQNVPGEQIKGRAKMELMKDLEIWDGEGVNNPVGAADDGGNTDCTVCVSGDISR